MLFSLALLSAVGVALCNGVAAVLEKISADKQTRVRTISLGFLTRLVQDWPFVIGIVLDIIAWPLTLVAVHALPLFVVQPIVAFSVIVTLIVERVIQRKPIAKRTLMAIGVTFIGLISLSLSASTGKARTVSQAVKWMIVFAPIVLVLLGSLLAKFKRSYATVLLAAIGGIAFGGTAITGRMLVVIHPYYHILFNPVLWSLFAYGLVGIVTFTMALQRHQASAVNAAMVAFETLVPIIVGITLLGDSPKHGRWAVVGFGVALTLIGTLVTSLRSNTHVTEQSENFC